MQEPPISEQNDLEELSEEELLAEVEVRARRAYGLIESLKKATPPRTSPSFISFIVSTLLLIGALYFAYWPMLSTGRTSASLLRISAAFVAVILAAILYRSVRRVVAEFEQRRQLEVIVDEFDRLLDETGLVEEELATGEPGEE